MPMRRTFRHIATRRAFTLVEALVSTSIATIAGTALLLGISSSIQTTDAVLEQAQAEGMAEQLMDEIAGCLFVDPVPTTTLGPDAGESNGARRDLYDDLDDYAGLTASPPCDYWGIPLGTENGSGGQRHASFRAQGGYFAAWEQRVAVYFAAENDLTTPLPAGQSSLTKVVRVSIHCRDAKGHPRRLTELVRVFSYVPK